MTATADVRAESVESGMPRIPVGEWIDRAFDWVEDNLGDFFDPSPTASRAPSTGSTDLLDSPPALLIVVILAALAWLVRDWKVALASARGPGAGDRHGPVGAAMETLALVLVATLVALVDRRPRRHRGRARGTGSAAAVRPVLDLMQTMPAFVYLVPVVTFFGIGVVGRVSSPP